MPTQPLERKRVERKHEPPYKVLLHNDDHNTMDHVVGALIKSVPQLSAEQAASIMMEAHQTGVGLVIVAPLEHAEFYQERLQSFGLTVTLEPAE
jgi:ATP-dependent Clp protease adaptor protein ClpS